MTQTHTAPTTRPATPLAAQLVRFGFYKLVPAWWQLPAAERAERLAAFRAQIEQWQARTMLSAFSTIGTRPDSDFLLWQASEQLDDLHDCAGELQRGPLGPWLSQPHAFLSMTRRSLYVREHAHAGQEGTRLRLMPGGSRYLFVYPFVKTRAWYALPFPERQRMMDEHIRIGHEFPSVSINTTYSYGLDDQEFVLAFESDSAADFLNLVMRLRETEASLYTLRDTPMFTCLSVTPARLVELLGG